MGAAWGGAGQRAPVLLHEGQAAALVSLLKSRGVELAVLGFCFERGGFAVRACPLPFALGRCGIWPYCKRARALCLQLTAVVGYGPHACVGMRNVCFEWCVCTPSVF